MSGVLDGLRARLPARRAEAPAPWSRPRGERDPDPGDRAGPSRSELEELAALGIYNGPMPGDPVEAPTAIESLAATAGGVIEVVMPGSSRSIEAIALGRPDSLARREAIGEVRPSTSRRSARSTGATAAERTQIVELAGAAGWPKLEIAPGVTAIGGEAAWRKVAGREDLDPSDAARVIEALDRHRGAAVLRTI